MKNERYEFLLKYLESSFEGERNFIANLANASAVINQNLENLNWAGFYLYDEKDLVLGPFQGKPACVRIKLGKGVCGTAAANNETLIVHDVHEFPGHMFNLLNTYITSPLDQFEIRLLFGLQSSFIDLSCLNLTTFSLYTIIVLLVITSLYLLTNNNNKIIGSR